MGGLQTSQQVFHAASGVARFTGFAPGEISALVNRDTVLQHVSEAAFLWLRRESAARAPHFNLDQLHKLDARVIGHLQGLVQPGVPGTGLLDLALGQADAGVVFAATHVAFFAADTDRMHNLLRVALTDTQLTEAFAHGIAWLPAERTMAALKGLRASPWPAHQRVSLLTAVLRRSVDTQAEVMRAATSPDAALRATGMRAVGELGLQQCLELVQEGLEDPDEPCRFWAARSALLLGDPAGAPVAWEIGLRRPELQREAISISMRCGNSDWARSAIRAAAKAGASLRLAIQAAGEFGDPMAMPWLLDRLEDPACARVAGEAITYIAGADIEYLDLDREPPEDGNEHDQAHPDDTELRWPDPVRVRAWWTAHEDGFRAGTRYLWGRPTSDPEAMVEVLRRSAQRQRQAAAIELARGRPGYAVFPVAQRADWQLRRIAG